MLKRKFFVALILAAIFWGCEKDPNSPEDSSIARQYGAFILNEGNFGKSNGSLSFLNLKNDEIINHIYEKENGENPGDVVQSMTLIGDLGYIVVNNSDKIEVISLKTWKNVRTIFLPAGSSPRQLLQISANKAYITNMYSGTVSILNLDTYEIGSFITVGMNPDAMTLSENKIFVANHGFGYDHTVSVIDVTTDKVINTINVADNPTAAITDSDGDVHILCTGRYPAWGDTTDKGTDGALYIIDPASETTTDSSLMTGHPTRLAYDGITTAYFLNGSSVVSYSTETNQILNDPLISGDFFYAIAVHPLDGDLYLLDPLNYSQNGFLKIFGNDGTLKKSYEVGLIPGHVTFKLE